MAQGKSGWVTFSWIIFLMAGLVNVLYGAAALVRKEYFPETGIIFQSLQSHGWVWLLFGLIQVLVAVAIASRFSFGRVIGIIIAVLAVVIWFYYALYLPNSSMALILIYVLVLFGLGAHGEEFD